MFTADDLRRAFTYPRPKAPEPAPLVVVVIDGRLLCRAATADERRIATTNARISQYGDAVFVPETWSYSAEAFANDSEVSLTVILAGIPSMQEGLHVRQWTESGDIRAVSFKGAGREIVCKGWLEKATEEP